MKSTEITTKDLSSLPASRMLAFINTHHMRFVLTEVERFSWMNLVSDRLMKVIIVDFAVLIHIKLIEYKLELLFSQVQSPMCEVEPEFILSNSIISLFVDVRESFSYSLPLSLYLFNDCLFKSHIHQLFRGLFFITFLSFGIKAISVLFVLWIFN